MISFDEAVELVVAIARPFGVEAVALEAAGGRILAAPVTASCASPATVLSAMDGYAVRECDLTRLPARLPVLGESFAGRRFAGPLPPGACIRIFTGAPLPVGADRVIIQEDVRREGREVVFEQPLTVRRHLRKPGSDFRAGDVLVPAGRLLNAQRLVASAAADLASLEVFRRPRLALLATGDELATPGEAGARPDLIPESVSFGVAGLAQAWGASVISRRRCGDHLPDLQAAARAAVGEADVVVVTGGASVGEKDFAREMFAPLGLTLVFSKVAIKPGKPVWIGRAGGAIVVGLPGNPTSALVTARLFLAPLLAGLAGRYPREALAWLKMPLRRPLEACVDRETFVRGVLQLGGVDVTDDQDSSAQRALAASDILIRRRPGDPAAAAGDLVSCLDF